MATKKSAVASDDAPLFPLGDPAGVVRWTPAMRKRVFPRRELAPKPPKRADLAAVVDHLRANADAVRGRFDAGATVPGADAALHAQLADAHAWIAGDPLRAPLDVATAALVFQLAVVADNFRAEPFGAELVDLLVARGGLAFAVESLLAASGIAFASGPDLDVIAAPTPKPRRGYGSGPTVSVTCPTYSLARSAHIELMHFRSEQLAELGARSLSAYLYCDEFRPWLRLREHLAAAPEAAWSEAVAAVEARWTDAPILARHLAAFCFPERPAWAEALAVDPASRKHSLFPMLTASMRDPSTLPHIALHYCFEHFEHACASMLAAAGPAAVPGLIEVGRKTRPAAESRYALSLVAQVDADAAVGGLLAHAADPRVAGALAAAEANFPERAARLRAAAK